MALTADYVTNQPLTFKRMRQLLEEQGGGLQEGVVARAAANEFKVSQRAVGGASMSVDVQAGGAWVEIDTGSLNGFSHIESDAITNVAIPAAHATLPRIDQIVLQYNDTAIPAGVGGDIPTLRVIGGTATAGAQSTNSASANYRLGAAALPNDCVRIADVQVDAAVATIVDAKITDRRPWARGAYNRIVRTAGSYGPNTTTMTLIDAVNLQPRVECSGAPLRIKLRGRSQHATASTDIFFAAWIDGVAAESGATDMFDAMTVTANRDPSYLSLEWDALPTAGSHLVGWAARCSVASIGTIFATTASPLQMIVEEVLRSNANNN